MVIRFWGSRENYQAFSSELKQHILQQSTKKKATNWIYVYEGAYTVWWKLFCYFSNGSNPLSSSLITDKTTFVIFFVLGMQGPSIQPADKRALPEAKILPEYFKVSSSSNIIITD